MGWKMGLDGKWGALRLDRGGGIDGWDSTALVGTFAAAGSSGLGAGSSGLGAGSAAFTVAFVVAHLLHTKRRAQFQLLQTGQHQSPERGAAQSPQRVAAPVA